MKGKGRGITCLLGSLTVICLAVTPGSRACPRPCTCYVSTEVHCTFRYLTSIPDSIPASVERINLGYNSLARLTENNFCGLNKLELLMLHSNDIHTVADKTFSDLQALQVLKMSYNKLQKIQKDTFYGLRSLTRLHLDHNSIAFINPEAFYGLTLLRLVQLEGNQLTKLHPDTFVSLSYLQIFKMSFIKYLYLSDNFLTSLPEEMVSYMPDLESLYLHGNPWTCDCHLKWLSNWTQGKPDVIKCKKDRSPSSPQQCPLCMNPRISKGKRFAMVATEAFLCTKPTIDPSLKSKSLAVQENSESAFISAQDFMAPFGSLTLNMTDLSGNNADVVCNIQRPSRTLPIAFTEENDYIMLNMSFSTNLICSIDYNQMQTVWQILALYSDSPLILERKRLLTETPKLSYQYKQVALMPEDTFSNIEADLKADPSWLIQDKISLQLNRTATTLSTLQIQFSCDGQITFPKAETSLVTQGLKWTMILTMKNTKLEHTVMAGGTITLDCPGHGDPSPYLEWLLADGSKVRAPYVSEDGRILIDKNGKLELQMADNFDSGLYHCISTNYVDADILTFRITVVEPDVEAMHEKKVQQTVFTGDTLDLPCHSTGFPDASISWVLPGHTVFSQSSEGSRDRQILNNGTLRISQVTTKDQGNYRCVAANPSGVDFLIFHISVQTEGQGSKEHDGEADGSGLEELTPSTQGQRPPPLKPSTSVSTEAAVGKQVSSVHKKNNHREFARRGRGDSKNRRFREHRRQFSPSARRIDPQHWAALLEKAKKGTVPGKQENTTAMSLPLVGPLVEIPGEDEHSSGMISLEEEFVVLKTKASSVPVKTAIADSKPVPHGFMTNITSGTDISSSASPKISQSKHLTDFTLPTAIHVTAVPKNKSFTRAWKTERTTNPDSVTIFPSVPGIDEYQDAVQGGRRGAPFQGAYPVTERRTVTDGHINMLRSTTAKAGVAVQSVNPTDSHGHQIPGTGVSKARTPRIDFHTTQELSTPKLPSDSCTAAPSPAQIPRNSTTNFPLSRRFGRQRKIWGRGRIISPYRTPVLRRHRYGIVRPALRGTTNRSSSMFSVTELHKMCPSCPSTEKITQATVLGSSPSTLPEADITRVIAEESPTVVQNLSLLFKNMLNVDLEKTVTIKSFSTESIQATPTDALMTSTPASTSLERGLVTNNVNPSVSSTSEAERNLAVTSPPPVPLTKGMPTKTSSTKLSRRKIPWHQIFVNSHNQRGILKNLRQFGLQKSTATMFPEISPLSLTEKGFPSHPTRHSASLMQNLSATMAVTQHNTTETHNARSLPLGTELPFSPFLPMLPNTTSKRSSTVSLLSVITATVATPTTHTSVVTYKTQTSRPKEARDQIKEPQSKNHPKATPTRSTGFGISPAPSADTSVKPIASAHTQYPQDTSRIMRTAGLHSGTLSVTGVTEEPPQVHSETSQSATASETTLFSKSQANTTVRSASAAAAFLSSEGPPMPEPTFPLFTQSPVTDSEAMPVFKMMTNTMASSSRGPSRLSTDLQQSRAEAATPPEVHANPELIPDATHQPDVLLSTPAPTLRTETARNSERKPSPWPESQFQNKSYLEIVGKDRKAALSMRSPLGSPEANAYVLGRDEQKGGKENGLGEKQVPKPASEVLPSDLSSKNILKRPRIIGGKAASFTVSANSDAFLPCEAVGNPLPTIRWTRVSSGLELSQRTQQSRFHVLLNGTLSIQKVSIQDRGQYLCSASNPLGTDHLHVTLSVVSYPPRILERRTNEITVHSGSTVELKCRVEGRPSPTISWILANQTVVSETSERKKKILLRPDGTLVIYDLSIYDRGFYKCIASNPAGQDSLLVKIQVITAPPVILDQKRQVIAGTLGESLKLPCTAKGTPQPSVHWVLPDGTELKPWQLTHSKLLLYSNGTLYIKDIAPPDRGTYECIATSSSGSERRVIILTVEERETIPRIEVTSQKWTKVNLGEKLLLNCSATGNPKPRIIWRLPSKAVIDQWHRMGSRIQVYSNGSLFIESVTEKDGGDYLCVARNKMGDDLILMHVSLRLTPAKIDHKQHFKKQVLHGKDFQVDCKASGSPVPEISWSLPDGTRVNNVMQADDSGYRTKRYTLFHNGTLYFNKVGVSEEGDYTCYAQNTLGKDEMKVHLTVITATPRIRQGSKTNVRIKAGDTAVLDCEVTGEPKPNIFWLLPSSDIILFSNDRYTFHANGSLSINQVKLLDSGEYVCVARNPSGNDSKMYKLDVVSKPPLINGLYRNKTVIKATAVRHSKKRFDCRVDDGTPSPQIMWIMPDSIFLTAPYYGSRITVHKNGTLEIRNVRLSDSADFICVVRSEGGESMLVVQLEVLEMLRRPTFRNPFNEKVVAQLGKSTTLNCSVDGNPPPEIIWILPNGTRFSNGAQNSPYLIASNGSLIIYKMTRKNSGKYRCAARNKVGYIEKLILLESGQKPVILTYAPGMARGISGESLPLNCMADGIPKPNVKWTTPSGYVIDRPQVNAKYILHENGTLVIKEATAYDRGNYMCKAQNSVGQASITVPVMIVAYPPRIITRPPRSIFKRTGVPFQLHCTALGVPKPEITWEMPGHSLLSKASEGKTQRSEKLHPQGTLVIQNPQTSDSGAYKCIAQNLLGSDYATTHIQVI